MRWKVSHLFLGDIEPDSLVHGDDGADRNGHFLSAPHMTFPEEYVRHPVIGRVHGKALDLPDFAI